MIGFVKDGMHVYALTAVKSDFENLVRSPIRLTTSRRNEKRNEKGEIRCGKSLTSTH